jgi:uncharacterized membrane protein
MPYGADWLPITSHAGVLATLAGVCAFFYWLEKHTLWRLFQYLPPLVFMYLVPVLLSNMSALSQGRLADVLPNESPVYEAMQQLMLPMMLVLLLLNINVGGAIHVMGRGVGVMLCGSLGVMVGAVVGLFAVKHWLGPEAWKAFGALSASWIGGTGNLAAVSEMLDTPGAETGLAVLADSAIYSIWLPILLVSKMFSNYFARFTGVDPERLNRMARAAEAHRRAPQAPATRDYLFLIGVAVAVAWVAELVANQLPEIKPVLIGSTWRILLITTLGIALSFTSLSQIPGSQELGMALVLLFLAQMGASADLSDVVRQAPPFLVGALICVVIHGAFCILAAKLLRTDLHTAAIASAANIGGVAAASVVASHHQPVLVPAAILMALLGYAIGNYCGYVTALLCRMVM